MNDVLFSNILVNGKSIKNRIVVPALSDFGATGDDCKVNQRHLKHYGALAMGGAGLIITEACVVDPVYKERNVIIVYNDGCIPGMTKLAEECQQNGSVAIVQLVNAGIPYIAEKTMDEITDEAFRHYKQEFVDAAVRCKKAGFVGVELHAAHGFYLNRIIETGQRPEEYGGSIENRTRIVTELIKEIKHLCGEDFIVAVRIGNSNLDELAFTASQIEKAGGDIVDISSGMSKYTKPDDFPYSDLVYAASVVKKHVSIPVICVGDITTADQARDILTKGYADLTAVGKGHLCDPEWANKALAGIEPYKCKKCKNCMWFIDGAKCPVARFTNRF